jgi:carbon monoxide dehydrogenase subunit G
MKRLLVALTLLFAAASALAGEAMILKVSKSVEINAPAAAVWGLVKDFDALNRWHPAVAKDEIIEGENNAVGAVRQLTLGDGGTIHEKLLAYDAQAHTMKYSILDGVLPVSAYVSTIEVTATGPASCKVTWSGAFKRKDTGESPAKDADDATATGTMESVYQGGLDNLKKLAEAT